MPENTVSNWTPPVNFYFRVDFQRGKNIFSVSFTEVSGLNVKLDTCEKPADTGICIKMPGKVSYGDIILKRPAVPLKDDKFIQWVDGCLKAVKNEYVVPYDMIVKLLDTEGKPLIGWQCVRAYPIQWTLSGLDSGKSELATETIVITCNRIERTL